MYQSAGAAPITTSKGQERVKVDGGAAANIPKTPSPASNHRQNVIFRDDQKKESAKFHTSKGCGNYADWCSAKGKVRQGKVLGRAPSSSVNLPYLSLAASLPARGVTDTGTACLWLQRDSNQAPLVQAHVHDSQTTRSCCAGPQLVRCAPATVAPAAPAPRPSLLSQVSQRGRGWWRLL